MRTFLALFFLCSFFSLRSQDAFPSIEVEKIEGRVLSFPNDIDAPFSLVGVAMSKKAEEELRTWQVPIYNKFIAKTGLMDDMFDVEVAFIPVFTGASQLTKTKVVKKLKENNEKLVLENLYIYSGKKEPFIRLGVKESKEPYFYLLDADGSILWSEKGAFRQAYLDRIEEILVQ